jgi:hypothetical protein
MEIKFFQIFRYNDLAAEKLRVEQENNSLRHYVEEERKEKEELRRQQQVSHSSRIDMSNLKS